MKQGSPSTKKKSDLPATQRTFGHITIPVITVGHILLFQRIDSPLIKEGATELTNQQLVEILYILNTPAAAVLQLLKDGRAAFEDAVVQFAAEKLPVDLVSEIGSALAEQISAASSKLIKTPQGAA